jgi:hypothetical protein
VHLVQRGADRAAGLRTSEAALRTCACAHVSPNGPSSGVGASPRRPPGCTPDPHTPRPTPTPPHPTPPHPLCPTAQVPEATVWYGPDTYMGRNLAQLFASMAELSDEEIRAVHPGHDRASVRALLPRLKYYENGTCIVHHIFGGEVRGDLAHGLQPMHAPPSRAHPGALACARAMRS